MTERALPYGLQQERNKQLHVDTTLLRPLEHKRSAMMVIQNADVARPWLVACACSCLPYEIQPASAIKPAGVDRKGD